jgi:phosphoribosylanthranilate isomerase
MMWVKICANTNVHDAKLAAELGADAVGFVFAPSKRQVTAAQVAAITPELPPTVARIGVFHSGNAAELIEAVEIAGLTGVQLHGRGVDPELIAQLNAAFEGRVALLQVVSFEANAGAEALRAFEEQLALAVAQPGLWAVLLDTAKSGVSGGLGVAFDWAQAAAIVRRVFDAAGEDAPKLIVAGGLRAGNVSDAIAALAPFGVDVASGVEAEPGTKDSEKLRAFIEAARGRVAL